MVREKIKHFRGNFPSSRILSHRKSPWRWDCNQSKILRDTFINQSRKAFADSKLIKSCLFVAFKEMCPEKINSLKTISLLVTTVAGRVEGIGSNIDSQLKKQERWLQWFSLALDESTDVSNAPQLFIWGVGAEMTENQALGIVQEEEGPSSCIEINQGDLWKR